jgi:hypothetical protein
MPNWCTNVLLIKGDPDNVQSLLDTVKEDDTELSLNKIITCPEELLSVSAPERDPQQSEIRVTKYGAKDWYDWNVKNWGTKWNVTASIYSDSSERVPGYSTVNKPENRVVKLEFDSAWSPPIAAITMLAKQFPKVDIYHTYDESGCDFAGYNMYSKGVCVKEEETDSFISRRMYYEPEDEIFDYFPDKE